MCMAAGGGLGIQTICRGQVGVQYLYGEKKERGDYFFPKDHPVHS